MSTKRQIILKSFAKRLARAVGATAIAALIGFLTGPEVAELIPAQYAVLVSAVLMPLLLAAEKALRLNAVIPSDAGAEG